ncbi:MAG: hypothetical protein ABIP88_09870 [Candidatus Binatia bacterium]
MSRAKLLITALLIAGLAMGAYLLIQQSSSAADRPRAILDAYLRATYARNFVAAYDYLSTTDRQVRPRRNYVDSQAPYSGFTLEVAQQLAGLMEIWLIDRQESGGRLVIKVGYRVPAPAELNDLLFDWDENRLNALSMEQQKEIVAKLTARKKSGKLLNIEGQETVELIEEAEGWKVHLDWAADTRVLLASKLYGSNKLEVRFAATEVMAKNDELFLVNVKIKNPSVHAVTFSVGHLLEPPAIADHLQLVECGLLTPTTLAPQQEKEFAMAYLLNASEGNTQREVKLTYEFKLK